MIPSMPEILPKILVVDDDRHTRILFDRLLARTAVVSLAVDGAEARRLVVAVVLLISALFQEIYTLV